MSDPVPVTIVSSGKTKKAPKSIGNSNFTLVSDFLGYRNKEDITNLAPGFLVAGSRDVLNTTGGRISVRRGYTLDGQTSSTITPITASYDWICHNGNERNVRAGNGKLEFRYVASAGDKYLTNTFTAGQVYWIPIMSSLSTATNFNFAEFWDASLVMDRLLFVNGTSNIFKWSGGVTTFLSGTANTITKTGVTTWAEEGFSATGSVTINGHEYTYTGGSGTTTLTGTQDAHLEPANSVVFEKVVTTANSAMTALPATVGNDLISVLKNQIYIGSLTNRCVYVSKVNSYTDYGFTSPVRIVGEGAILTLDSTAVGFVPQESDMYITSGKNDWYITQFTLASDLSGESLQIKKLKTGSQQAALSQASIGNIKNSVVFISNEPTLDELGRVEQILGTPQQTNMSDPIKNDFDKYDFTDASVKYHRYFIYVAVPKENIVLMYNLAKGFWEVPQYLPISRFAVINGELYGHSYQVPETYKMFSGYNDNGKAINAIAKFSYQNYGERSKSKYFNEYYVEGYIDVSTTLTCGVKYETDGCSSETSYDLAGTDTQVVCIPNLNSPLGKESLGKNPLGGELNQTDANSLPPKFRVIYTFPRKDFFEVQYTFSSVGVDQRWELLASGAKVEQSMFGNNNIKK